jgi:hypothetical protein
MTSVNTLYYTKGRSTSVYPVFVGAGSPTIIAVSKQSQKLALPHEQLIEGRRKKEECFLII